MGKKILPKSLNNIIKEKKDNLRKRRFESSIIWKVNSIADRLTKRANKDIGEISIAMSKKGLANKLRKETLVCKYKFLCKRKNCYTCIN